MSPAKRLLSLLWMDRRDLRTVIVFAAGTGVLSLAVPLAVETLVTTVAFGGLIQPLVILALLLLAVLGFSAAMRAMMFYVVEIIQRRFFVRMVSDLSHRLTRARSDAFDERHGPELVNRFFDVMTVQKAGAGLLIDGLTLVLNAIVGLAILAFYHPLLLGFDVVVLAATAFLVLNLGRGAISTAIEESISKYETASWLEQLAGTGAAFRSRDARQFAMERSDAHARKYLAARSNHFRIVFRQILFALGLQAMASTLLLGLGGWLVIDGSITLGQLVAAELIVTVVVGSFAKLGKHMETYYDLLAALDKIGHLLDLPLEHASGDVPSAGPEPAKIQAIDICYETDGRNILEEVRFEIAAGERVLWKGPGGSGKSAMADMLYGMRSASGGRIEIDGTDVRHVHLPALRDCVALVRDGEIIEGSIEENVRMGRLEFTSEEVREALAFVDLLEETLATPEGFRLELAHSGRPLSHQQIIRLLLARAVLIRPRLLIIDGLLDALDEEHRQTILDRLLDPERPWTLIVIGQAVDANGFDRVLEFRDRRVVERSASQGSSSVS